MLPVAHAKAALAASATGSVTSASPTPCAPRIPTAYAPMPMNAAWPNDTSPAVPTSGSGAGGAIAKIITRAAIPSSHDSATYAPSSGVAANAPKTIAGTSRAPRAHGTVARARSRVDSAGAISSPPRREQAAGAEIQDSGHQQIDRHRRERRADRARGRRREEQAQQVAPERAPERVDQAHRQRRDERSAD